MSGKAIRETFTGLGVVASMIFVGLEIRQSNVQARAAAYQAIGIASAQYHQDLDDDLIRLYSEAHYAEVLRRWTFADWERYQRNQLGALRMVETVLLQVEQRLLDADALDRLGFKVKGNQALATPAFECIWPDLSGSVGASLRDLIDETLQAESFECEVDIQSLRDETILGKTTA